MKKKIYIVGYVSLDGLRKDTEWSNDKFEISSKYHHLQKYFEKSDETVYTSHIVVEVDLSLSFKEINDFIEIKVKQHLKSLGIDCR